jgi:hypothetical protein
MAYDNSDVADAINFLEVVGIVGFGEGGRVATWAKVSVGNPFVTSWSVDCRISRIETDGIDDSLTLLAQGVYLDWEQVHVWGSPPFASSLAMLLKVEG